jgi:hypothetical protein
MTTRQRKVAQRNVQKAQKAARSKKTISNPPSKVRSDLGRGSEGCTARWAGRTLV